MTRQKEHSYVSAHGIVTFGFIYVLTCVLSEPENGLINHFQGLSFDQCVTACKVRQFCCSLKHSRYNGLCMLYSHDGLHTSQPGVKIFTKPNCSPSDDQCESGFCLADGKIESCSEPFKKAGTYILGNMVSIGSKVKYVCLDDSKQAISECLSNGTWSVIYLQCRCSEPVLFDDLSYVKDWTYSKFNSTFVSAEAVCSNQCSDESLQNPAICDSLTGIWFYSSIICCNRVCPDSTWKMYRGSCYKITLQGTFNSCDNQCKQEGGYIVDIGSDAENRWLKDLLSNQNYDFVYIGIKKVLHTDGGRLSDHTWANYQQNTDLNFTDFFANDGSSPGELCVVMWRNVTFQWVDVPCSTERFPAICEINIY